MIKPPMLSKHVLITGATGFLGGAIVAELHCASENRLLEEGGCSRRCA